jgi:hypothetical protein
MAELRDQQRRANAEIRRQEHIRRQLRKHTFGRVKNYVLNRGEMIPGKKVWAVRKSSSTPSSPLNSHRSPAVTPRMVESLANTPRTPRASSSAVAEAEDARSSCYMSQSVWRVRVWLRLTRVARDDDQGDGGPGGGVTVQLCHACRPTCNYGRDLEYVRRSGGDGSKADLDRVLWYRFLGR